MDSEGPDLDALMRRTAWRLLPLLALALAAAWAWGGAWGWADGQRARVVAALGLLLVLALMWGQVLPLWREARARGRRGRAGEGAEAVLRHRERAAALSESLLDQAPVALWLCQEGGQPEALNGAARRWLAPGGARDAAALLDQLREQAEPASRQRSWLRVDAERGEERCLLASRPWVRDGRPGWLLALLPLESALEAETLRAWRQLVQVLTHEIMNSLTPIASLARSAQELQAEAGAPVGEDAADLAVALEAIARRAEALSRFVADYRHISDWPAPRLEPVPLQALFERLAALQSARWQARGRGPAGAGPAEPAAQCRAGHAGAGAAPGLGAGAAGPWRAAEPGGTGQRPRRAVRPGAGHFSALLQHPRARARQRRARHRPGGGAPAGARHGRQRAPAAPRGGRGLLRAELLKRRLATLRPGTGG